MIFQVENGSFCYLRGKNILHDIDFTVRAGEIMAVLGPNGVGKTTLLKCMMGLLKWESGDSLLNGESVSKIALRELWKHIAYVPQAKNAVLSMTAYEMILLGRNAHIGILRQPAAQDKAIAESIMEELKITYLAHKQCNQMSGGELQMVLVARALTTNPELLVLDEPESNLDFKNQLIILETMERLARERNLACIFNTHYPSHALSIASNALLLNKNGGAQFGSAVDIINEENMKASFQVNVHISSLRVGEKEYKSVLALSVV